MAYLLINNHSIPIENGGSKRQVEEVGGRGIALDGTELSDVRSRRGLWTANTVPVKHDESVALSGLILGKGHVWDFGDATYWEYSGKGLGSSSSSGATRQTANPKWASAHLRLAATTGSFAVDPEVTLDWTVMIWRDTGSGYEHYAATALGGAFVDGVADSFPSWISVSAGIVTITNTSGSTVDYDGLVVLPYVATNEMIASFAASAEAFPSTPSILCRGDMLGDRVALTAIGRDVSFAITQGARSSTWKNNLHAVQFGLREESRTMDPVPNGLDDPFSDWAAYYSPENITGVGPYTWDPQLGTAGKQLVCSVSYSSGVSTGTLSPIGIGVNRVNEAWTPGTAGFVAVSAMTTPSGDLHIRVPPFRPNSEVSGRYLFSYVQTASTIYITAQYQSSTTLRITWRNDPSGAIYQTDLTVTDGSWHLLDLILSPDGGTAGVAKMTALLNGSDVSPSEHSVTLATPANGRLGMGCWYSAGTSPMLGDGLGWGIRTASGIDLATHQAHVALLGL